MFRSPKSPSLRSPWLWFLGLAVLLQLVQVALNRYLSGPLWGELAYLLVMYAAVALAWAARANAHPQQKPPLTLFGLALTVFTLGDTVLTYFEVCRQPTPNFSIADPLYYLYYLLMGAALIRLIRIKFSSLYALAMLLDSMIIVGIVWIFAWFFVLAGGFHQEPSALLFRWVSLSYVGLDLSLLGLVLLTLRRHRLDTGLVMLVLGLVMAVGADLEFSYLATPNDGTLSLLTPLLWSIGTALQALGIWLMRTWTDEHFRARPPRLLRLILGTFPYLAVLASCILMVYTATHRSAASTGVLSGTVVLFFLVLLRQALVFQENLQLTRELRRFSGELERSSLRLQHQVHHDDLTGLPNRQLFTQHLKSALHTGEPLAVLFIDLDGFKFVNDTFGHSTGDQLLCQVAERFQACLPERAVLARIGGDEFTAFLPGVQDGAQALSHAARFIQTLKSPFHFHNLPILISASIGISLFPEYGQGSNGPDTDVLQSQADIAMYHAKAHGKNRASIFNARMDTQRQRRYEMEGALRRAIENQELELYYQPQFRGPAVQGVEALLRWHSPQLGQVSPSEFIPLAEETGFMLRIGQWVLSEACQQAARWQGAGHQLRVAVNVSPLEFTQQEFVESVAAALRAHDLPGGLLELEITEGLLMQDVSDIAPKLQTLRNLGVRISLDDFGVGHSSLSQLMNLPADALKMDRSFLIMAEQSETAQQIIRAVCTLGLHLKLDVMAEGVETPAQHALLTTLGCDQRQGNLFARPMPAHELDAWLAAFSPEQVFRS